MRAARRTARSLSPAPRATAQAAAAAQTMSDHFTTYAAGVSVVAALIAAALFLPAFRYARCLQRMLQDEQTGPVKR